MGRVHVWLITGCLVLLTLLAVLDSPAMRLALQRSREVYAVHIARVNVPREVCEHLQASPLYARAMTPAMVEACRRPWWQVWKF